MTFMSLQKQKEFIFPYYQSIRGQKSKKTLVFVHNLTQHFKLCEQIFTEKNRGLPQYINKYQMYKMVLKHLAFKPYVVAHWNAKAVIIATTCEQVTAK